MKSKKIADYIKQREVLFWYTPAEKLSNISLSFLTETILNYGTMDDIRELFAVIGVENAAKAFREATRKSMRDNYFPEVKNYFTLYFNKYAP
jgi:hypothetical protein